MYKHIFTVDCFLSLFLSPQVVTALQTFPYKVLHVICKNKAKNERTEKGFGPLRPWQRNDPARMSNGAGVC